jgi:hypothetical protein
MLAGPRPSVSYYVVGGSTWSTALVHLEGTTTSARAKLCLDSRLPCKALNSSTLNAIWEHLGDTFASV